MSIKLNALIREQKNLNILRQGGLIPAVLYGHNTDNVVLAVSVKEFDKIYKEAGESTIVELEFESGKKKEKRPVLIHDVQFDCLKQTVAHIDFYQVRLDEKIKTKVALEYIGEAPAVKAFGGILVKAIQEIEVEALPNDLPHNIIVDLTKLEVLDSDIYVKDLSIPPRVKIFVSPDTVVASVTPPRSEEELAATKEEVAENVSEVKIETEEKRLEREQVKQEKQEKQEKESAS